MPILTVITKNAVQQLPFQPGTSVRGILEAAGLPIRSGCRGNGGCGLCTVEVASGDAGGLTRNEGLLLTPEQVKSGVRLACQLRPENDLGIRIRATADAPGWRDLDAGGTTPGMAPPASGPARDEDGFGLAIDLGTTTISLSLWNLGSRSRLCGRIGPNPQGVFGADVVTRLIAAGESPDTSRRLAQLPWSAVRDALHDMCAREAVEPRRVKRVVIVGNTAMLILLTGADPAALLQPRSWSMPVGFREEALSGKGDFLGIGPGAHIECAAPFAGFVGPV